MAASSTIQGPLKLETVTAEPPLARARIITDPLTEAEGLDLVGIMSAIEETAYIWDLNSDRMEWESNAAQILGISDDEAITTGAKFQLLIAPEHLNRRAEAFSDPQTGEHVRGVPYRVQYRFLPAGRRSEKAVWIEDYGRWWPGANGRPVRARGVLRVINDRYWEEQRLLYRSDLNVAQAVEQIRAELPDNPELDHLTEFVTRSGRGIIK